MPGQIIGRPADPAPITEPVKPAVNDEPLIDLKTYNDERKKEIERLKITEQKQSKFKCSRCGARLYYDNPDVILARVPPQKKLVCKECNNVDYVLA